MKDKKPSSPVPGTRVQNLNKVVNAPLTVNSALAATREECESKCAQVAKKWTAYKKIGADVTCDLPLPDRTAPLAEAGKAPANKSAIKNISHSIKKNISHPIITP